MTQTTASAASYALTPFIGYLAADGRFEAYGEEAAKGKDYHHSFLMRDLDAYEANGTVTFVRMDSGEHFTINGEPVLDPYAPASKALLGSLARRLIGRGALPSQCYVVEELGMSRAEAPYQGKNIGTLARWAEDVARS